MFKIVNFTAPDLEAVNISPTPALSTTNPAKEDNADTDATEVVPANAALPVTLKSAEAVAVPPTNKSTVELAG